TGLVRGRSIAEGEALFEIERENGAATEAVVEAKSTFHSPNFLDHLRADSIQRSFDKNVQKAAAQSLVLIRAALLGFYSDKRALENICKVLTAMPASKFALMESAGAFAAGVAEILSLYRASLRLFSPSLSTLENVSDLDLPQANDARSALVLFRRS